MFRLEELQHGLGCLIITAKDIGGEDAFLFFASLMRLFLRNSYTLIPNLFRNSFSMRR